MSDAEWVLVEPLLPVGRVGRGRPRLGFRGVVDGVLWRFQLGRPWRHVPVGFGSWEGVYGWWRRWVVDGTWVRVGVVVPRVGVVVVDSGKVRR